MSWLESILTNVGIEMISTDVILITNDTFHERRIHCREDGMALYGPSKSDKRYEIVLNKPLNALNPDTCFSLYRSPGMSDAKLRFSLYHKKVTQLVKICPEVTCIDNLQKLCNSIYDHPDWNLAHLSAELLLYKAIQNSMVKEYINDVDYLTGISPIQIAIKKKDIKMIKAFIFAGSFLENRDFHNNTVFHYAAETSKEIILLLDSVVISSELKNEKNDDGYAPIFFAAIANNLECMIAFLSLKVDVNFCVPCGVTIESLVVDKTVDTSGGTLLHYCDTPEMLNTIIDKIDSLNATNNLGETAVHVMVRKNNFKALIILLGHTANVNIKDFKGNSPLHFAVNMDRKLEIVQLLIAFGADINETNDLSQTPRHLVKNSDNSKLILNALHLVGAKRCIKGFLNCTQGCASDGIFNGTPFKNSLVTPAYLLDRSALRSELDKILHASCMKNLALKSPTRKKGGRLLCLDGGGVKGLVLVQMLMEIEKILKKPITHCFDWIAGTSTGGILALGLGMGKSLQECVGLYFLLKDKVFNGSRPYPAEPLEEVLQDLYGTYTSMKDTPYPKIMITSVRTDLRPVELKFFRNYQAPFSILTNPDPTSAKIRSYKLLWCIGRATSAAPTFFPPFDLHLVDGGIIANNPTLDAMTEIHEYNLALDAVGRTEEVRPLSIVVSLGTGLIPKQLVLRTSGYENIGVFKRISNFFQDMKDILEQLINTDGRVIDRARSWCSMIGIPYYRFNPEFPEEITLDEKNDNILMEIMWLTKVFMHNNNDQIIELANIIDLYSEE